MLSPRPLFPSLQLAQVGNHSAAEYHAHHDVWGIHRNEIADRGVVKKMDHADRWDVHEEEREAADFGQKGEVLARCEATSKELENHLKKNG